MEKIKIGDRIKKLRNEIGYTQEQLAEKAQMSKNFLGEIERNEKLPGINIFSHIVIALNTSADYILYDILPSGKSYVYDEITEKLEKLEPKDRKVIIDLIDAYIKNIK